MKKKDTMKMRREWVNEVLDTLDDLEEKAETNGESALMWEILKTVRENIEIQEQGGNALFFCWAGCGQSPQPDLPLYYLSANLSSVFCKKKLFFIFPKTLDYFRSVW